ncbi:MotE family protein [Desulfotalea psychrophila]|uniref:Magnesium transporter MgtE intracellular domain-containing protein n=1 Tax=Desulfotalea psychrophila (strain LSv54 / DSM 12343) TaxID=177439 RepID=Q6AJT6_DESPS|nr:hypothetical protein [Desulfotalea psychrophila]CAG37390.1 unknown protein [Desulfotalea psychrophila LSv54]
MKKPSQRQEILTTLLIVFFSLFQTYSIARAAESTEYGSVEERRLEASLVQNAKDEEIRLDTIIARKNELKILEKAVDKKLVQVEEKITELKKIKLAIDSLLEKRSATELAKLETLAKIYGKMDAPRAARAIASLDRKLASNLLAAMKAKSAAKILDQLPPRIAGELTTKVSGTQLYNTD